MTDMTDINLTSPPRVRTAVAAGLFDGVHIGHRKVIEEADRLPFDTAVFTFMTETVTSKPGMLPLMTSQRKKAVFTSLGVRYCLAADFMRLRDLSGSDFVKTILKEGMNAAAVVCGEDFRFGANASCGTDELKAYCKPLGIETVILPPVLESGEIVSSTTIRTLIGDGKIERANILLGEPFCYSAIVVRGRQLGRTLDFPTINQRYENIVVPMFGVYLSRTSIGGSTYSSVTNIGVRPTVCQSSEVISETHLIGCENIDLYGMEAQVSLLEFIRGERKFSSVEELKAQVKRDIARAKR